jgi:hypothetical protein
MTLHRKDHTEAIDRFLYQRMPNGATLRQIVVHLSAYSAVDAVQADLQRGRKAERFMYLGRRWRQAIECDPRAVGRKRRP